MSDDGKLHDIRFAPTDGLTYNPSEPKYWDKAALQKELDRAFELCAGCRLCFKYCQSFPTLFDAVDRGGGVRALGDETTRDVVEQCFQCKLCYTQCPYTEAEGHEFKLDFPRLMTRAKAVRRRAEGIPLRDRLMANPDLLGRVGCATAPLANWANRFRPNRLAMEVFGGIHRDKLLPRYESETFDAWFRRETGGADVTPDGRIKALLFETCFVDYNRPSLGQAAVRVLRHNDCQVACPKLECCGMPALDAGDVRLARRKAERNVRALLPWVERGFAVAVINPTCSLMIRDEYPRLLDDPADPALAEAARRVAAATKDISEFLFGLKQAGEFKEDFRSTPNGPIAYHAPCHLRMQAVGFRGRDLMRRIPGAQPRLVQECCGHDGTWAMKKEYFELAMKNGRKAFEGMDEAQAEVWTTDCPLAALQFEQARGVRPLHPVEVLDRAYRADGFPTPVAAQDK